MMILSYKISSVYISYNYNFCTHKLKFYNYLFESHSLVNYIPIKSFLSYFNMIKKPTLHPTLFQI